MECGRRPVMYINSGVGFARQSAGHTPSTLQDFPDTVVKWSQFSDCAGLKTMNHAFRKISVNHAKARGVP